MAALHPKRCWLRAALCAALLVTASGVRLPSYVSEAAAKLFSAATKADDRVAMGAAAAAPVLRSQRAYGAPATPAGWRIVEGAPPPPPPPRPPSGLPRAAANGVKITAALAERSPAGAVVEDDVTFYVMMRQRNLPELESTLLRGVSRARAPPSPSLANARSPCLPAVSDPLSDSYGAFLSFEDLSALVGPSPEDVQAVTKWLLSEGVPPAGISARLDTLRVTCAASIAARVLDAELAVVHHEASGARSVRATGPLSAPATVAPAIDFFAGLTEYFDAAATKLGRRPAADAPAGSRAAAMAEQVGSARQAYPRLDVHLRLPGGGTRSVLNYAPPAPQSPDAAAGALRATAYTLAKDIPITPAGVRALYGIPPDAAASAGLAVQGVAAFDDIFEPASLCAHEGVFGAAPQDITFVGSIDNVDKIESDLDVQYIAALAPGAKTVFRNQPAGFWMLQFAEEAANNLLGIDAPSPDVWSISYGWPEAWQCGNHTLGGRDNAHNNCHALGYDSEQYIARTNAYLAMLGAAGVSVVVSSGDTGAQGFAYNCPIDMEDTHAPWGATADLCADMEGAPQACGCAGNGLRLRKGLQTCLLGTRITLYDQSDCSIMFEPECAALLNAHSNITSTDAGLLRVLSYGGPTRAPNGCSLNWLPHPFNLPDAGWSLSSVFMPVTDCECDAFPPLLSPDGSCTLDAADPVIGATMSQWRGMIDSPHYAMFPSASPYVTSVGATQLPSSSQPSGSCDAPLSAADAASEVAASIRSGADVTSGGGFSLVSPRPAYQDAAVSAYLDAATGLPPAGTFNSRGRAYPDVSMNGHKYLIFESDSVTEVDGTSASAPALSALITLLNDELLSLGATPLGFLNPLFYHLQTAAPDVFNDVQSGDNRCTETSCCRFGFDVQEGWDPVTGLGTVNFAALRREVLRLKGVPDARTPAFDAPGDDATATAR